jgi:hypothetical protein
MELVLSNALNGRAIRCGSQANYPNQCSVGAVLTVIGWSLLPKSVEYMFFVGIVGMERILS